MNKFELNRVEELINRLYDRDISNSDKSSLMQELSQYPEYKESIADFEEIRNAIHQDKTIILPPKELDKAVLANVDKLSESIFRPSFFMRNKYALIGLLLLFVGFTGYIGQDWFNGSENQAYDSGISQNSADEKVPATTETQSNQIQQSKENIPVVSNSEIKSVKTRLNSADEITVNSNNSDRKSTTKIPLHKLDVNTLVVGADLSNEVKKTLATAKLSNSLSNLDLPNKIELENEVTLDPRFNLVVVNSPFDRFGQNKVMPISIGQNKYARALLQKISKTNLLLQYRGLYAVSNPEKGLQGSDFFVKNYCFGGFVEAFDGIYLGAEFGDEPYSQIFMDKNTSVQFEQTANIFYFGVAGKFAFKDVSVLGIYPAAQLFAGSSSLGPITRSNLTLQYDMMNRVGMFFGVEGGMVFYSQEGVWYNSGKLGLIGGLNIKL
jgi:hypothetical protein